MNEAELALKHAVSESIGKIRRGRPQMALSRELGFKGNQVQRWESGQRQPGWPAFVDLCLACDVSIVRALYSTFQFQGDAKNSAQLISHLIGPAKLNAFCESIGVKKSIVSKWKNGRATPTLLQMLHAIERSQGLAVHFLDALLPDPRLRSLDGVRDRRAKLRSVLLDFPEAGAVLAMLNLAAVAVRENEFGQICRTLGLEDKRTKTMLAQLVQAGWIEKQGSSYKLSEQRLDTRGDLEAGKRLRQHWLARSQEILQTVPNLKQPHRFGVLLLTVSEEADRQIEAVYQNFFGALKQIVSSDRSKATRLRVVNVQDLWLNS